MNKLKAAFLSVIEGLKSVNSKLLFNIVIIALLGFLVYIAYVNTTPAEVRQTLKENKKLQDKIDSISQYNKSLSDEILSLEENQAALNNLIHDNNDLIQENNNQLIKLKKLYNAKIDSVNGYTISQLDSFFTKRYPH